MDGLTITKFVLENPENTLMNTNKKELFRNDITEKVSSRVPYLEGAHEYKKEMVFMKNY